jgi:hypothetical protein
MGPHIRDGGSNGGCSVRDPAVTGDEPERPEDPEDDGRAEAVERRWREAAAGKDPLALLEHLYGLRREPRRPRERE